MYVTLEPCTMCAAARFADAGCQNLFGVADAKKGAVVRGGLFLRAPTCHHRPIVEGGILQDEAAQLLKAFFGQKRQNC